MRAAAGRVGRRRSTRSGARSEVLPARFASAALAAATAVAATAAAVAAATTAATAAVAATTAVAAAATEAARTFRPGPRFVDGEIASTELVVVELVDRLLCLVVGRHLDEREPARTARRHVAHHLDRIDRSGLREELLKLGLASRKRQVPDVQLPRHLRLSPDPRKRDR